MMNFSSIAIDIWRGGDNIWASKQQRRANLIAIPRHSSVFAIGCKLADLMLKLYDQVGPLGRHSHFSVCHKILWPPKTIGFLMKGQRLIILAPLSSTETINILAIKMMCFFNFTLYPHVSPVYMVTQYKSPTPLWGSWWIWYPRRSRFLTICTRSSWPKCRTCLAMGDPAVGCQTLNFPGFPGAKMKRSKTHPGWFKGDV